MSKILAPVLAGQPFEDLDQLVDQYRLAAWSRNTLRAYRATARAFAPFLRERRSQTASLLAPATAPLLPAAPAEVAAFLVLLAQRGRSTSSIAQAASAIRWLHLRADLGDPSADPAVRQALAGIRRIHGRPARQKKPLLGRALHRILDAVAGDVTPTGRRRLDVRRANALRARNTALLLLGFALAARRSELVALDLQHLEETPTGYRITIPRSKTDPDGRGSAVAVDRVAAEASPVEALERWLELRGRAPGPLFLRLDYVGGALPDPFARRLSPQTVRDVIQDAAAAAGLDAADFGGHSLRRALATAAAAAGAPLPQIARAGRWSSFDSLRRYLATPDDGITRYLLSALLS